MAVIANCTRPWVRNTPTALPAFPGAPAIQAEPYDFIGRLALAAGLGLVLVRFGMLHELINFVFHINLLLVYVFSVPALLGLALSGGIRRAFRGKISLFWIAYALWLVVATPFSSWRGGSADLIFKYLRSDFIVMFVIAGLVVDWRDCKKVLRAIACGGLVMIAASRFFRNAGYEDRFGLAFGTVSNPNDYAAVLLLVLPIVLWLGLSSGRVMVRLAMFAAVALGVYTILATASRGATFGLLAEMVFFLWRGTGPQRITFLALGGTFVAIAAGMLPERVIQRLQSYSLESDGDIGAAQSARIRKEMLRLSIEYTIQHPIFGVGPGQIGNYEGQHHVTSFGRGYWRGAHNTFLQVASESGIPALVFFTGGFIATYRRLSATWRKFRDAPAGAEIRTAALCIMTSVVGFGVAIAFLNFAYMFYAPALGGVAVALSSGAEREMEARGVTPVGSPARA